MYKLETILTYHIIIFLPNLSAILGNYSFKPGGDALHQPLAQLIVTVDLLHILVMMVFSWGLFFGVFFLSHRSKSMEVEVNNVYDGYNIPCCEIDYSISILVHFV